MKKSEVISIIQFYLYDNVVDDDLSKLHSDAERILEKLEEAGMLPPSFKCNDDEGHMSVDDLIDCANIDGNFEWEPEN